MKLYYWTTKQTFRLVIALVLPAKDGKDGKVFLTAGGEEMEVQN